LIYLPTYLLIYLSTYLLIYLSTYLLIYLSIYLFIYSFTLESIFGSLLFIAFNRCLSGAKLFPLPTSAFIPSESNPDWLQSVPSVQFGSWYKNASRVLHFPAILHTVPTLNLRQSFSGSPHHRQNLPTLCATSAESRRRRCQKTARDCGS